MKRMLFAALLSISAIAATGGSTQAQCSSGNCPPQLAPYLPAAGGGCQNHFSPFGCGGFCMGFLSRTHFHGPLFNYGPYSGYYPFEPYGPWTSNLQYNPPPMACGQCGRTGCGGHGIGLGWGKYAVSTLKNVFHRTSPLAHRCGGGLNLGSCDTCGSAAPCAGGGCSATATSVQTAPAVAIVPKTVPVVLAAQAK